MLWGIWQGKGKPPFNAFFEPFTSEMNKLYREGRPLPVKMAVCKHLFRQELHSKDIGAVILRGL